MYIRMIREIVLKSSVAAGRSCCQCSNKRHHLAYYQVSSRLQRRKSTRSKVFLLWRMERQSLKSAVQSSEIATAAEQFLGKSKADRENEAKEVLEGHLRSILVR